MPNLLSQNNGAVEYSTAPTTAVVLEFADGLSVLGLPLIALASAEWRWVEKEDNIREEKITCAWGERIVTIIGHGLRGLTGDLLRGQIRTLRELPPETISEGTKIDRIEVTIPDPKGE